jgi:Ulp1 family protease
MTKPINILEELRELKNLVGNDKILTHTCPKCHNVHMIDCGVQVIRTIEKVCTIADRMDEIEETIRHEIHPVGDFDQDSFSSGIKIVLAMLRGEE